MFQAPFTLSQFQEALRAYNDLIFPAQMFAYVAALFTVALLFQPSKYSSRIIAAFLALIWLGSASYQALCLGPLHAMGIGFTALFIGQAAVLFLDGLFRGKYEFRYTNTACANMGLACLALALFGRSVMEVVLGRGWPYEENFAVTPDTTILFTCGMFLLTTRDFLKYVLIIPMLWSCVEFSWGVDLGLFEKGLLPLVTCGTVALLFYRDLSSIGPRRPQMRYYHD